jgi:hypothetical protein
VKEKRAAIFDERKDEQLTTKDKGIFKYREKRPQQWRIEIYDVG